MRAGTTPALGMVAEAPASVALNGAGQVAVFFVPILGHVPTFVAPAGVYDVVTVPEFWPSINLVDVTPGDELTQPGFVTGVQLVRE